MLFRSVSDDGRGVDGAAVARRAGRAAPGSDAALLELLNDRIRQIPGVQSTETSIYLNLYKQTYQWGTR